MHVYCRLNAIILLSHQTSVLKYLLVCMCMSVCVRVRVRVCGSHRVSLLNQLTGTVMGHVRQDQVSKALPLSIVMVTAAALHPRAPQWAHLAVMTAAIVLQHALSHWDKFKILMNDFCTAEEGFISSGINQEYLGDSVIVLDDPTCCFFAICAWLSV